MNLLLSPALVILFKWTLLLAFGWAANWLLRERHSRWRLILWRSILCFGLILPLTPFLPLPAYHLPVIQGTVAAETPDAFLSAALDHPVAPAQPALGVPVKSAGESPIVEGPKSPTIQTASAARFWPGLLPTIWIAGAVFAGFRLFRLHLQLIRIMQGSRSGDPILQYRLMEVQARLAIHRTIDIRVSDLVSSPFACGVRRPIILLPQKLVQELPPDEISALLAHEIAHFRHHDLFWCVAWRWILALFWFHPLVWKIPAAHTLACEQEADRMASGQLENRGSYAQLLARLALRVLALPEVETQLVLNGSAQIMQRLDHLKQRKSDVWNWRYSVAGFGLVSLLFLTVTGCQFSETNSPAVNAPANSEFKRVQVVVQDESGKPITGATIRPFGFRVKGVRRVDGHGWNAKQFGPVEKVLTDQEGKAWLKYPVVAVPEEELLTGELTFVVSHPDYCPVVNQGFPVDGTGKPFHLAKGIVLEVSGYYGKEKQPVTELVPTLGQDGVNPDDWKKNEKGVYTYRQMAHGGHLLQLMGRLASGDIVYSDSVEFTAEAGKTNHFQMEMSPGIRIEGRLDDSVQRPVKNGRVLIAVRPRQMPAYLIPEDMDKWWERFGSFRPWRTYRPISEDGTFVFESVPPGEVDVIVHGDGFVSKSIGKVQNRINGQLVNGPKIGVPQPFSLAGPVTKIEIVTEPTATLELTATTKAGAPIAGAPVYLNPNVLRIGGIFGDMRNSSEKPFRNPDPLPNLSYSGRTDGFGKVVIKNIPSVTRGLEIVHPKYVIPLADQSSLPNRRVRTDFAPGATNVVSVTMQPVGKDFIGTAK